MPPAPCEEGFGAMEAGPGRGGRRRAWGASLPRELSLRPSAEVRADVPGCPPRGNRRPVPRSAKTMAFVVKTMVGGQLKNLTGSLGGCEDKGDGDKSAAEAQGMSREEYEEYQKQLVEEK